MTMISTNAQIGTMMTMKVEEPSKGAIPCQCGKLADVDLCNILTSNPPMYGTYCQSCHARNYIYTSEYHKYYSDLKWQATASKEQAAQDKIDDLTRRLEEAEKKIERLYNRTGLGEGW